MTDIFEDAFDRLPKDTDLTREEGEFIWEHATQVPGKTLWIGPSEAGPAKLLFELNKYHICFEPTPTPIIDKTGPTRPDYEISYMPLRQWQPKSACFTCVDIRFSYRDALDRLNLASRCGSCYIVAFGINDKIHFRGTVAATRLFGQWEESVGRLALWNLRDNPRRKRRLTK